MWSSTSQLFQHRINQSTARKIIHTWTHELATPGTPLGADPNTSLHESAKKKRKKENVKINDFESEFCTAKTAFNEKSHTAVNHGGWNMMVSMTVWFANNDWTMTSLYQRMIEDSAKKLQRTEGNDLKHRSKRRKKWQREELKDFEKKIHILSN